jgi:hypothetical protein
MKPNSGSVKSVVNRNISIRLTQDELTIRLGCMTYFGKHNIKKVETCLNKHY